MSDYRTQDEIQRFDLVKLIILVLLIVVLAILLLRGCQAGAVPPKVSLTATAPAVAQPLPPQPTPIPPTATQPMPTAIKPVAPRLTSPVAGAALNDGKFTLKGTGQPNSRVQILVGGKVVGEAQVGADGAWTFAADLGKPGSYELVAQAVDANGNVVSASDTLPVTLTAPTPALAVPALTFPSAADKLTAGEVTFKGTGTPGSEVELAIDGQVIGRIKVGDDGTWSLKTQVGQPGTHQIKLRALDSAGKAAAESAALSLSFAPGTPQVAATKLQPAITSPAAGASLPVGEVTLAGTGAAGDEIEILDNGKVVGTVKVGADGQWRFAYVPGSGDHELSGRVKANPSTVSGTLKVSVAARTLLPSAGGMCVGPKGRIEGDTYIVGVCDTLTRISQNNRVSLEALLAANPQIEDPNLIYMGQVLQLPH